MVSKKHICYLYIFNYKVLKNIGLKFDDRFKFEIEDNILHIYRNPNSLPKNFWGSGIYSLTAIVGENGSGKSTVLRLMKKLFVDGEPRNEDVAVAIVYEYQGDLYIYNPNNLKIVCEQGLRSYSIETRKAIETFYYSSHFQPYTGAEGEMELSGSYDATDTWLLINDLLNYSNFDSYHLTAPIYNHLSAYYAQNNYRICEVLLLDDLEKLLVSFRMPRYILIAPNKGGWNAIKLEEKQDRIKSIELPNEKYSSTDIYGKSIERFIYYNIVNLIAERKGNPEKSVSFLHNWQNSHRSGDVIKDFEGLVTSCNLLEEERRPLEAITYVIRKMVELCEFDEDSGTFYIDIKANADKLRALVNDVLRDRYFLTARFFDIYYGHSIIGFQRLSSGELELLNLLSRLYYGITLLPQKYPNKKSPRLLLLDEAEIGFHPDWQRQYVKVLTEFMQYMRVKSDMDFQIVITSHSPIILSDIPVCCINFLHRRDGETKLITGEKETFGENVFNLYRRAFFMDSGLVGEFARIKMQNAAKNIEEGNVTEETLKTVDLIGDDRIREYLRKRMASGNINSEIAYHEEKIRQLRKLKEKGDE